MHEATSVETVSIAKASIVATLPAQTAVLAGANPKYGRFDPYKSVLEQLDISETLLSRFDLKFALKDKPDRQADERVAEHITMSRISPQNVVPEIDPNLLKKYIAYAKRITSIEITQEAAELMKKFYVDMRNAYPDSNTVSITLRQYEALLRLAEAAAKIRLDTRVSVEDAQRSINLVRYSLIQLGYDYETGRIDIDKLESGITSSQRSKIRIIQDIITALEKELGKEVNVEDVIAQAEEQGIERNRAEETIRKLKDEGLVFEPKPGFIKRT
jgi:replicative DNA helicase Mcm